MRSIRNFRILAIAVLAQLLAPVLAAAGEADPAWAALQGGGNVALMRHASAPGTGDPPGFRLEDCTTQRNLSPGGRREAEAVGESFRRNRVRVDGVYSSQWCRCLETARLLGLGEAVPFPPLNSFLESPDLEEPQMAELRAWLAEQPPEGTLVLVTHQVVITSLTGVVPASGEIVVAKPTGGGRLDVVGRIPPPG